MQKLSGQVGLNIHVEHERALNTALWLAKDNTESQSAFSNSAIRHFSRDQQATASEYFTFVEKCRKISSKQIWALPGSMGPPVIWREKYSRPQRIERKFFNILWAQKHHVLQLLRNIDV